MDYCTYAYLREDGTPYYIGKGKKYRPYSRNRRFKPPSRERILILKQGLSEQEAIRHEMYMIFVLGRKDNGTGILRNLTDGGEGISGYTHTEKAKKQIGKKNSETTRSQAVRDRIAESVRGFSWYNNGSVSIQAREAPGEGWKRGRILGWESPRTTGMRWFHKGDERRMFAEDPGDGWVPGRPNVARGDNPTNRGKRWYNDGNVNKMFVDPPEGWVLGMIKR